MLLHMAKHIEQTPPNKAPARKRASSSGQGETKADAESSLKSRPKPISGKRKSHGERTFRAVERSAVRGSGPTVVSKRKLVLGKAMEVGLLTGDTARIAGRMHRPLVAAAKERTGIKSDTELLEYALARVALEDTFAETLVSLRGSVSPDLDLEFRP